MKRTVYAPEHEAFRETIRTFIAKQVTPNYPEWENANQVPRELFNQLAELGATSFDIPEEFGGAGPTSFKFQAVIQEETARAAVSFGHYGVSIGIVLPYLLRLADDEQKQRWLPRIASGELMVGVMVTEPDYGSDVAGVKVTATPTDGGYRINGVKTWATFAGRADVLMLLARTDPDRSAGHRGLSLFVVDKEPAPGHDFSFTQDGGGKMEGRAIDTLGYRGMHSYEVAFDDWLVPEENLVGGDAGLGKGFYLQMEGFENGRLQTAARAVGLMQAAYEAGASYARERTVFGKPVGDYQLSRAKLARIGGTGHGAAQALSWRMRATHLTGGEPWLMTDSRWRR